MGARSSHSIRLAGLFLAVVLGAAPSGAATIPAWLDAAVGQYNEQHPERPIRFVDIKDSYVWYEMDRTAEVGQQLIRERVQGLVLGHGYEPMGDEDLVTTARPPARTGASKSKKCWKRSFVLTIEQQSGTKAVDDGRSGQQQRMLTSLVCEDGEIWWAAFRVLE